MKKIISLLLAVLLLCCTSASAFAKKAQNGFVYPTVYICGRISSLYNNLGTEQEYIIYESYSSRVSSPEVPDIGAYAKEQAKVLLPKFVKALITDQYEDWATGFSAVLQPIYQDFVLDRNGKARAGSGVKETWDDLPNIVSADGTFPIPTDEYGEKSKCVYDFPWDWRLSPLDVADSLRDFIDTVLAVTGKKKVNLVSRCEGCCVAMAYFYKYSGDNKVANNVLLGSSANGVGYASNIFAGKFDFNATALKRYIGQNFATGSDKSFGDDLFADDALNTYFRETLCLLAETHSLEWIGEKLEALIKKLAPMVYPGLLMSSYGTCPGYWAMVRDDDYQDAKALAGLNNNDEWANFVALIDEYHDQVQQKSGKILKKLKKKGVSTAIICKYGAETLPFVEVADEISDNTALVKDASYGATTAKIDHPFSAAYIHAAAAAGKGAYIAPDRMIDASTCLFPETTWFLKYMGHDDWEGLMLNIYRAFIDSGGTMTVGDKKGFVRFYSRDENGREVPMTDENADLYSDYYHTDRCDALTSWIRTLRVLLLRLPALIYAHLRTRVLKSIEGTLLLH